jgi:hypothetical protein
MRIPRVGTAWVRVSRVEIAHDVVDVDLYMGGTSRNRSSTE